MSAATVSYTKKNQDGSLVSIGGTDAKDFELNLVSILGQEGANEIFDDIKRLFTPTAAGASNVVQANFGQQQPAPAAQAPAQPAAVPPQGGNSTLCPSHNVPMELKTPPEGKTWTPFYKCTVTGGIVSEYQNTYKLKNFCPQPKARG